MENAPRSMPTGRQMPVTLLGTACFLTLRLVAQGDEPELPAEDEAVASRIPSHESGQESDHATGDWGGVRSSLLERGFHVQGGYVAEVFGNLQGGLRRGAEYQGLAETALDFDPAPMTGWRHAQWHVSALYPHGASVSGQLTGDLTTASNIDAPDAVSLFEWWLEQRFADGQLSVRLGQLAADEEFAGTETGSLFLNSTFGWPSYISLNTPAPSFPRAALGARVRAERSDVGFVQAGVFDGDPDSDNPHGANIHLDADEGALILGEAGCEAELPGTSLPGRYVLGGWYHTGDFDHLSRDRDGLSLADPAGSGVPRSVHGNWGFYGMVDQWLWHEARDAAKLDAPDQGLSGFLRAAGSPSDRNLNSFYLEAGLACHGPWPGRDRDRLGLAAAYVGISDELSRLTRERGEPEADYEVVIEVTYDLAIRPWWFLQPDFQYLIHPGGSAALDNAVVVGLRNTVIF